MGNNIVTAQIAIKGLRPLLWHAFTSDAIPLQKQERTGVAGNDPEEWKKTVLMTAARQLYVTAPYIFGMIRDASRYTKKGKGSIQASVAATLQVTDDLIVVDRFVPPEPLPIDRTQPVYLDVSSVRNPATKGRNVRYRVAASAGWALSFGILWDRTIVSQGEMRAVLNDAGQLTGLGDGRSIGYGRFTVEAFEVADA